MRPMDTGGAGAAAAVIRTPDASVPLKRVLAGDDRQDAGASLALRDEAVPGTIDLVGPQFKTYAVARRWRGGLPLAGRIASWKCCGSAPPAVQLPHVDAIGPERSSADGAE